MEGCRARWGLVWSLAFRHRLQGEPQQRAAAMYAYCVCYCVWAFLEKVIVFDENHQDENLLLQFWLVCRLRLLLRFVLLLLLQFLLFLLLRFWAKNAIAETVEIAIA